ncbi:TauD/TfdA dioxygenase family protein [Enemella sp. A6]|uniref:TauD/TfdA dioxygenase family protein n=1 Tax=Enemella sp. A6 TaxID=3440152 RepID=UPI003EBB9921
MTDTAQPPRFEARVAPHPADPLASYGPLIADRTPAGFPDRPYELFEVHPHTPTIGAEIRGVRLGGDLPDDVMGDLHRALLEWKVLFFRDQDIDRADHRAFASRWGDLEHHPFFQHTYGGQTDVDVATLAKDSVVKGVENQWHNDVTWRATPSLLAVLRAVEVPPVGGDTLWSDTAAAYDLLPDDIKNQIEYLEAEHDWVKSFGRGLDDAELARLREAFPPVTHPVVRVIPETGRKVLFVNINFTQRILGMSQDESNELLMKLYRQVQRPEFQVRLRWQKNTIAMWDNRTCQHYAVSDYAPQRRVMERISVIGDAPIGPSAG